MASLSDDPPFDIREQLARIDKMRAETLKLQEELQKVVAETLKANRDAVKVQQDTRLAPWTVGFAGVGTGAALLAAGAGLAKLLMG